MTDRSAPQSPKARAPRVAPRQGRLTKSERLARDGLMRSLIELQGDGWLDRVLREEIPEAWHTLEADVDVREPKEKVTLYLDRSVARFYRQMGRGYHARINRLLATWAQMKIAGEVQLDAHLARRAGVE
ncbi:BrnA antitoxin family protein [Roseovarius sp.]|uniref:BrnA antitoxin family protein n=1 Tax=Roseovarius sp. TaxID=1486281 RepID=UPI000C3945A7|nr:BrnA antitoxin family protein [Roseovarius sp.]MAO28061.1 hypothetical protein [Roseovarius sp.]MAZ19966.1 hypothetical protein [Roseovarius sp.]|tara:strand:+ start:991 stop:1377 length:387 start_codon:yes stop_codon:yes gene_type:complete